MLLLGVIIAASLILLFVTRAAKSSNEAVDLPCILDFFKRASSDQSPDERMSNLPMAIRYLNSLAAMHGNKQMRLQAAVFALKSYRDDDRVVLLALTQLSLLVNNYTDTSIQNLLQQDQHVVIKTIQSSLSRAKLVDEPPEKDERLSSEIQRRGCLLLGGCAENIEAAAHIIGSGGMNAIIDALQWYRFHAGVSKWGLWAVFHLCYDRPEYQSSFVEKNGIQTVCQCIKNNNCVDVTRHGIAILFDAMRNNTESSAQAKVIAFQEGLNDLLLECMDEYHDDAEICMMCQQILGGAATYVPVNDNGCQLESDISS